MGCNNPAAAAVPELLSFRPRGDFLLPKSVNRPLSHPFHRAGLSCFAQGCTHYGMDREGREAESGVVQEGSRSGGPSAASLLDTDMRCRQTDAMMIVKYA